MGGCVRGREREVIGLEREKRAHGSLYYERARALTLTPALASSAPCALITLPPPLPSGFGRTAQIYDMVVLEVKPKDPSKAISIIETDLQIDFAPALGMPDEPECVPRPYPRPFPALGMCSAATPTSLRMNHRFLCRTNRTRC